MPSKVPLAMQQGPVSRTGGLTLGHGGTPPSSHGGILPTAGRGAGPPQGETMLSLSPNVWVKVDFATLAHLTAALAAIAQDV